MSFTIGQAREITNYAKNPIEPGEYVFRISSVKQKVAEFGRNKGKDVYSMPCNPLTDNRNPESFDRSRTVWEEIVIPTQPDEEVIAAAKAKDPVALAQVDDFKKTLQRAAYWAECLELVSERPTRAGADASKADKAASYAAFEEWYVNAANVVFSNPEALAGRTFAGTMTANTVGEKTYVNLTKKTPVLF